MPILAFALLFGSAIFAIDLLQGERIGWAKLAIFGLIEAYFCGRSGSTGAKINEKIPQKRNFAPNYTELKKAFGFFNSSFIARKANVAGV